MTAPAASSVAHFPAPALEASPLKALMELAREATGASEVFVFVRLEDGSYVLEGATDTPSQATVQALHAALPLLDRDLAGGRAYVPAEDRRRSRIRARLAPIESLGRRIAYLGFIEGASGHLGALVLTGTAAVSRAHGERLATAMAPALSVKESEREQLDLAGRLRLRVYRLHTIFDLSRELSATLKPGHILRSLTTTLMGQLMVSQATVLRPHGRDDDARVRVHHFPRTAKTARRSIQKLPWISIVQAARKSRVRRNGPAGEALAEAGLARLYPMEVGGEVVGVVAVSKKSNGGSLTAEDDEFAKTLTNHAAMALNNARLLRETVEKQRIERELAFAQTIQQAILPQAPVTMGTVTAWGETVPCFEVGGDYFDVIEQPDERLLVAIGDVSGKGVPAALLMASVAATMRALAHAEPPRRPGSLARLLVQANDLVVRTTAKGRFVSLILLCIDTVRGTFRYVNAGHNPGLLVNGAGAPRRLHVGGMPLGLFRDQSYEEEELSLRPAHEILPHLKARIQDRLAGARPDDDMTFVAVTRAALGRGLAPRGRARRRAGDMPPPHS